MYGLALRLSKALRAAPADAAVLLTRALERVGLRRVPAKPTSRTGFLRGYSVPDDSIEWEHPRSKQCSREAAGALGVLGRCALERHRGSASYRNTGSRVVKR